MKKLFTLVAVALATVCANAQEKSWTFENWETNASVSSDITVDGLTLHATSASPAEVKEAKKSAEINGETVNYTKYINLKGTASATARQLSFSVDGPCEITVAYVHGSSTATTKRVLNLSYGSTYDEANLQSMIVQTGADGQASTVRYELDKANTIYIGSGNSGVNILGIYVKPVTPDNPQPATPEMEWDFTAPLAASDVANLDGDKDNWNKTEGDPDRYSYSPTFDANATIDNFFGLKLTANGEEIGLTKGLGFGRHNGKLDAGRFVIDNGKRLCVNGSDVGFIIPGLKRNDVVKVRFATGRNGEARKLILTNLTTTDECTSESNAQPQEVTCRVLSDGYVGFRGDYALYYYGVSVNKNDGSSGISQVEVADKKADGKTYNLCGMEVKNPSTGIYIKNGKKFVVKK